jgi:hypothetical protein
MRLDQPGLVIDAARYLGENVRGVLVAKGRGLVDRFAGGVAEGGKRCRDGCRVRFLVGDPELVWFEEGSFDGDVNRPFGGRAKGPRTFGNRVRIVLHRLRDLVEELMDGDESRPTDIPMGLFNLCVQIDCRRQMPVQQLG